MHFIFQARMFKKFSIVCHSQDITHMVANESILNEAEETCENELKVQAIELQHQQEEVLKLQSLLKLFLTKRSDIKKQLNDDFQRFCIEKYNMPLVSIENSRESEEILVRNFIL